MVRMLRKQVLFYSLAAVIFFLFCIPALSGETELDRVAYAVEGVESSHGKNPAMWRTDAAGPQGPMQVSEKAAVDIGGGNRFDIEQNRTIGRAYLWLLRKRYGNWVDAISAYNWGMSRVDGWIRHGRTSMNLLPGVATYLRRVMHDSGLATATTDGAYRASFVSTAAHNLPAANTGNYRARFVSTIAHNLATANTAGNRASFVSTPHDPDVFLPVLRESGLPFASLASSGTPLAALEQSGRPLTGMKRSGRHER